MKLMHDAGTNIKVETTSDRRESLDGADYHETLPGAPDGRYWVMRFAASYERKQAATETVTASWDGDAWRVSGYFIR